MIIFHPPSMLIDGVHTIVLTMEGWLHWRRKFSSLLMIYCRIV